MKTQIILLDDDLQADEYKIRTRLFSGRIILIHKSSPLTEDNSFGKYDVGVVECKSSPIEGLKFIQKATTGKLLN